jgi:hypothetical protein
MKKFFLAALTALFLITACEKTSVVPEQPTVESAQEDVSLESVQPGVSEESVQQAVSVSSIPCRYPSNCVDQARYARAHLRVTPVLPNGLFTYEDKRRIINRTIDPRIGSVAICNQGTPAGHVAVVIGRSGSGSSAIIRLHEANYLGVRCRNDRSGTAAQLRIVGYFY